MTVLMINHRKQPVRASSDQVSVYLDYWRGGVSGAPTWCILLFASTPYRERSRVYK